MAGQRENSWQYSWDNQISLAPLGVSSSPTRWFFKGRWSVLFNKKATEPPSFQLLSGGSIMVPLMVSPSYERPLAGAYFNRVFFNSSPGKSCSFGAAVVWSQTSHPRGEHIGYL
jgi:hypothetical protein